MIGADVVYRVLRADCTVILIIWSFTWVISVLLVNEKYIDNFQPGLQCESSADSPYTCGYTVRVLLYRERPNLLIYWLSRWPKLCLRTLWDWFKAIGSTQPNFVVRLGVVPQTGIIWSWCDLARTLTSWGYLDCQRDSSSVNSGGQCESLIPTRRQQSNVFSVKAAHSPPSPVLSICRSTRLWETWALFTFAAEFSIWMLPILDTPKDEG